jgi:hypothetical protein
MRYLLDLKVKSLSEQLEGPALAGMTWDDAPAELRVTLNDQSSPPPLPARVAARLQEPIDTGGRWP